MAGGGGGRPRRSGRSGPLRRGPAALILDEAAAARVLGADGVVAIPTDTVYGLACNPRSRPATDRIDAIKGRPRGMELTLLGAGPPDLAACGDLGGGVGEVVTRLAAAFWPGPLSIIVPTLPGAGLVVPRHGTTVSIRVPGHDGLRALLRRTGVLATTSANRHGERAAVTAAECAAALGGEVDGILDGGPAGGRASTIIDLTTAVPRLLRTGPISAEALRPHLGVMPLHLSSPAAGS